jgi:D-ribose pyranose/furanose isomerase RbsD
LFHQLLDDLIITITCFPNPKNSKKIDLSIVLLQNVVGWP